MIEKFFSNEKSEARIRRQEREDKDERLNFQKIQRK